MALWSWAIPTPHLRMRVVPSRTREKSVKRPRLMAALAVPSITHILCGKYADATAQLDEAVALAEEKGSLFWRAHVATKGCVLAR